MHVSRRRRTMLSLVLATGVCGCGSEPVARPVTVQPGATYHSPAGNFTCVVPPLLGPGVRESQAASDDGTVAGVTFSDDFGTLLDVQSRHIPDADQPAYAGPGGRATVDADVDRRVLPGLERTAPGSAVLYREGVTTPVGPATFVVVALPAGSTRTVRAADGTTYHPDAVRGLLVFAQVGWAYTVTVQQWPPTPNAPPLAPADRDARLLSDLKQAVGQMTFD